MAKFVTAQEAAGVVKDNDTLVVGGFSTYGSPEELLESLGARYEQTGHPKSISIISGITPGDKTESDEPLKGYNAGLNRLKADGLISAATIGLADARAIGYKINENKIAGYLMPMGILVNLFRATAGGAPGIITKVGLGTFCDPRNEGCAGNELARQKGSVVELMEIAGEEYLMYKTYKPNVCFIRGTYADEDGNISMDHEAVLGAELEMAAATHNKGGIVVVQVEKMVQRGSIPVKDVRIHGRLVDYVVVAQNPDNHRQSFVTPKYRPELSYFGTVRSALGAREPMKLDIRKVIARRSAMELTPGVLVNFGVGMPAGVASVAAEEGILNTITTSVESGPIGGVVQDGIAFPAVENAEAIYSQPDITNMYDGGLLDMTFLGAAEIDGAGNVNVSKFAGRNGGPGGFIDISQNAKRVVYMGSFTAGKADIAVRDGKLVINSDAPGIKFVKTVQQISFSGEYAVKSGQDITYITERAVFKLTKDGLELVEIAPGVDLEKDVLGKMEFRPKIAENLKQMDSKIFRDEVMGMVNS